MPVYDVADMLKLYFHELPDCLLTERLSETCCSIFTRTTLTLLFTSFVSEMTYNVSSGTLNPTIPYHAIRVSHRRVPYFIVILTVSAFCIAMS